MLTITSFYMSGDGAFHFFECDNYYFSVEEHIYCVKTAKPFALNFFLYAVGRNGSSAGGKTKNKIQ